MIISDHFSTFTFFPAQHWSHTWERQHELVYRLANGLRDKEIQVVSPLGLIDYNFFSRAFINKFKTYRHKGATLNINPVLPNMNFKSSFFFPKLNSLATSFNYRMLKDKIQVSDRNFFWSTYMNPVVYKVFKQSSFKIIDIAERRQKNDQLSNEIKELEKKAISEADIVFIDNRITIEDYKDLNPNIFYVPQGVNTSQFRNMTKTENCIGYMGNFHGALDFDYLHRLIEINADRKFLIVGAPENNKDAKNLSRYKNVEVVGSVPKSELQQYVNRMAIGLIPYRLTELTKGVFPTKLFEYLSAGIPVISTPIPEVQQYDDYPFIKLMEMPEKIDTNFKMEDAPAFIQENTWDARFNFYLNKIEQCLKK